MPGRSLRETIELVESAALALGHAHSQGIVHRDLQPANMMLVRQRGSMRLKVLNFGLAKNLNREAALGTDIGTFDPQYAAPEVMAGHTTDVGAWSDVWSLAVIVLEVLHGQPVPSPQKGSIRASALGVQVPPMVDDLLAKATALDPKARPTDAMAFWTRLRELQQQQPRAADPLAATAIDADAAAAIARVRAMTAGGVPQSDKGTMLMAQAPPHPEPAVPIQEGPLAGTKPIAIPSPLASSLGGNMKSPVANVPNPPRTAAMPAVTNPTPVAPPPPQPITTPPPPQQQQVVDVVPAGGQKSNTLIILVIVAVIALVAVAALVIMLKGKS
jgi:serine/threonine-protein kinase